MNIELSGVLGWIFTFTVLLTVAVTLILSVWLLWEHFLWDVLMTRLFKALGCWKSFVQFMFYRKEFFEWRKNNPNETE